ncbi:hypothetical protein [Arthrobacter sp. JZ12]|uniref:hypothetical protein n=1 Tax=Arthrobacter sp. JZ12 TaxID=2654190 RepID=UPI002B46C707|nr:hypothetical protein [Arthrobacter sp. JZ12]
MTAAQPMEGTDMGNIRCKTCRQTWSVSSEKTETVIAENHAYLNPGHRTITVWEAQAA